MNLGSASVPWNMCAGIDWCGLQRVFFQSNTTLVWSSDMIRTCACIRWAFVELLTVLTVTGLKFPAAPCINLN